MAVEAPRVPEEFSIETHEDAGGLGELDRRRSSLLVRYEALEAMMPQSSLEARPVASFAGDTHHRPTVRSLLPVANEPAEYSMEVQDDSPAEDDQDVCPQQGADGRQIFTKRKSSLMDKYEALETIGSSVARSSVASKGQQKHTVRDLMPAVDADLTDEEDSMLPCPSEAYGLGTQTLKELNANASDKVLPSPSGDALLPIPEAAAHHQKDDDEAPQLPRPCNEAYADDSSILSARSSSSNLAFAIPEHGVVVEGATKPEATNGEADSDSWSSYLTSMFSSQDTGAAKTEAAPEEAITRSSSNAANPKQMNGGEVQREGLLWRVLQGQLSDLCCGVADRQVAHPPARHWTVKLQVPDSDMPAMVDLEPMTPRESLSEDDVSSHLDTIEEGTEVSESIASWQLWHSRRQSKADGLQSVPLETLWSSQESQDCSVESLTK